jgi:sugar transferase (PEP-CTERM/EpsH1 system associated)
VDLLYLSHCVPNPPNKGEKIRAHFELKALARRHDVHLACFAREPSEMEDARQLLNCCASVYVAPLFPFSLHVARAGLRFLGGSSLNVGFYSSQEMQRDIASLRTTHKLGGAVVFTSVMAELVPPDLPFILDLTDVDSEKWLQYARERRPGFLFRMEAGRVRRQEIEQARRADLTVLTTRAEEELFRGFAGPVRTETMENGVDFDYFDPAQTAPDAALMGRRYLLFVGSLDYYPNATAVERFAREVFPALRAARPELEFLVVGRKASAKLFALGQIEGVQVVGSVDDVRPYYRHAEAVVAPLLIARGIQNKVLEALSMDRPVLASEAVCRTFGKDLPVGVQRCTTAQDYSQIDPVRGIRRGARSRFSWSSNLSLLTEAVDRLGRRR